MKRITTIFVLFLGIYYYRTQPEPTVGPEIDTIKLKMSSTRRQPATPTYQAPEALVSETEVIEESSSSEDSGLVSSSDEEEHLEHVADAPWDEMKEGWKNSLKDYLVEADPEKGEEIYNLYLEELSNYEAEITALTKDGEEGMNEDSRGELDDLMGQLDSKHEEKLKEILGPHYSGVTEHHQNYNNSLQYMNRGLTEVGVPL